MPRGSSITLLMTGSLRGHKFQLTRAEHGAVGSLHHSDRPQDEGEREDGKRDVAVGDLADRGAVQDVVGHHLLHGNSHASQVPGQAWKKRIQ
jgi:hypothetical protein